MAKRRAVLIVFTISFNTACVGSDIVNDNTSKSKAEKHLCVCVFFIYLLVGGPNNLVFSFEVIKSHRVDYQLNRT